MANHAQPIFQFAAFWDADHPTWYPIPVAEVRCEKNCCSMKQISLRIDNAITMYKAQGFNCGEGELWEMIVGMLSRLMEDLRLLNVLPKQYLVAGARGLPMFPKAVSKRRNGRFVEYLIVAKKGQTPGVWKRQKDTTNDEKDACQALRDTQKQQAEYVKAVARKYADAAIRGEDESTMARLLDRFTLAELEPYLAEFLNQANIRRDDDIGDWGNVKHTIYVYEDTPLIRAIRNDNLQAVLTLLRTGLCDPTLESCPRCYVDERYGPNEIDIRTALKCSTGTRMEGPIQMALTVWPTAKYSSHEADYDDKRKKARYSNRMHGVGGGTTQSEATELLKQSLSTLRKRENQTSSTWNLKRTKVEGQCW